MAHMQENDRSASSSKRRPKTPSSLEEVEAKLRAMKLNQDDEEEEDDDDDEEGWWVLKVGSKVRVKVSMEVQLKTFKNQLRVDFVAQGVWAMKFFSQEDYKRFVDKFQDCLFENTHGYESTEVNKMKVYGKDFIGWAKPEAADDSMWEDADESFLKSPQSATPVRANQDLREEFEEAANGGKFGIGCSR
ncbi:hypothetical protein Q3G72_025070 [Acer saccharum]|nr:hypothetical protein Q3G72_025070 [Acer saccharum]